ncbi:competence protein CoiA family protein, partial [Legionella pneumophila]|uniref:competence protein CoiA family protein n=2 Tax=Legionella pneumophila TaxID=446 RepID=UPI00113D92AC
KLGNIMKSLKIKLPFGLNENNVIVHITNVESGKNCNCICPSCSSPLIAAKGTKNQHHFKHTTTIECEGGLESAIHMAAKQIIKGAKTN